MVCCETKMVNEPLLEKLFWLDMEMTGLHEKTCKILEVAAVITNLNLEPHEEYHQVVFQPQEVLESMDNWCIQTHRASGLSKEVVGGVPLIKVENGLIDLGQKHFGDQRIVLCGNSISQDRKFIDEHMPNFSKFLHYRLIDVSSFKEIFRNKYQITFQKKDSHRARSDIYESIAELKHYLEFIRISK